MKHRRPESVRGPDRTACGHQVVTREIERLGILQPNLGHAHQGIVHGALVGVDAGTLLRVRNPELAGAPQRRGGSGGNARRLGRNIVFVTVDRLRRNLTQVASVTVVRIVGAVMLQSRRTSALSYER